MEDFLRIAIFIGAIAYYLYRNFKKAQKANTTGKPQNAPTVSTQNLPQTPEERKQESIKRLKKMMGDSFPKELEIGPTSRTTEKKAEAVKPKYLETSEVEEFGQENTDVEVLSYESNSGSKSWVTASDSSRSTASEKDLSLKKSFDDSVFEEFRTKKQKMNRYEKLLKSPQNAKDAVILAEILKPRHQIW